MMIAKSIIGGVREILYELLKSDLPIRRRLFRSFWRIQTVRKLVRAYRDKQNNASYTYGGEAAEIWTNGFKISKIEPAVLRDLDIDKMAYIEDGDDVMYHGLDAVLEHKSPVTGIYRNIQPHLINPKLLLFANSDPIRAIVDDYLGSTAELVDSASWITRPSDLTSSHSEFGFHRDIPDWKWLNVFIYLSDVSSDRGPHGCVAGTHTRSHFTSFLERRCDDERLRKLYGSNSIHFFTGPYGTTIFEDTSAYHTARAVKSGHRHMLQLNFSTSAKFRL